MQLLQSSMTFTLRCFHIHHTHQTSSQAITTCLVHHCGASGSMLHLSCSGPGFNPRSGQVSWVTFFRRFSSSVRQVSGSFRPPWSPNIIWLSLSSTLIHYGCQWPEMLMRPNTWNIHIHTTCLDHSKRRWEKRNFGLIKRYTRHSKSGCTHYHKIFFRGIRTLPTRWRKCVVRHGDYVEIWYTCVPRLFNKLNFKNI